MKTQTTAINPSITKRNKARETLAELKTVPDNKTKITKKNKPQLSNTRWKTYAASVDQQLKTMATKSRNQ